MNKEQFDNLEYQFNEMGRKLSGMVVTHSVDPGQVIPDDFLVMVIENGEDIVFQSREYSDFMPFLQERIAGLTQLLRDAEHSLVTYQGLWATDRPEQFEQNAKHYDLFELNDKDLLAKIEKALPVSN